MTDYDSNTFVEGRLIANRYKVIKLLGTGGMGSVYHCEDLFLEGNKVAVKVLHKEYCNDPNLEKRFLREVQLMNSVSNANVVRTFDAGRDKDILYFTMEYVAGTPLDELMNESGKLNFNQFCSIASQVCEGIEAIHKASIIHRDLKPSNIMILADGQIKITDFGVAKPKSSTLTQHNEIIGSVDYIAPEIWLGNDTTTAVDIYSLGIIFYQMVTDQLPFSDDEPTKMMMYHVKRPPTPPIQYAPEIPAWLNLLILKMLAKSPNDRPKSANEIAKTIQMNSGNIKSGMSRSRLQSVVRMQSSDKLAAISADPGDTQKLSTVDFSQNLKQMASARNKLLKKRRKQATIFLAFYIPLSLAIVVYFYLKIGGAFKELLLL